MYTTDLSGKDKGKVETAVAEDPARVAAFEASRDAEGAVHVRIELAPRTAGALRRAAVATTVRPRVEGVP